MCSILKNELLMMRISDICYDLRIKGQVKKNLEPILQLVTDALLVFLTEVLPILYND